MQVFVRSQPPPLVFGCCVIGRWTKGDYLLCPFPLSLLPSLSFLMQVSREEREGEEKEIVSPTLERGEMKWPFLSWRHHYALTNCKTPRGRPELNRNGCRGVGRLAWSCPSPSDLPMVPDLATWHPIRISRAICTIKAMD